MQKVQAFKNEIELWRDDMKTFFATKEDAIKREKKLVKRVSKVKGTLFYSRLFFGLRL